VRRDRRRRRERGAARNARDSFAALDFMVGTFRGISAYWLLHETVVRSTIQWIV
jgi:hypothetical protein